MTSSASPNNVDHWSSEAYQNSASFVPKLATVVLNWLDVQKDDIILDIGCGDGVINLDLANVLAAGSGRVHGIDSSVSMIESAMKVTSSNATALKTCSFEVLDATSLLGQGKHHNVYDKVFSNAAMHWILRPDATRERFFPGVQKCLKSGGTFVFEMGGMGNVTEMRSTFLSVVARRVGIDKAREADPWFFPDEQWLENTLKRQGGWEIVKVERVYRPTKADRGGVEAWVRLMGKQFFDVLEDEKDREDAIQEAIAILQTVCRSSGGGDSGEWIGYVRLRAMLRKL